MTASQVIEGVALGDLALLSAGLIALSSRFRRLTRPMRWLVMYLGIVWAVEILAKLYVYEWLPGSNLYLLHIYTPLEFALLGIMYLYLLDKKWQSRLGLSLLIFFLGIVAYSVVNLIGSWNNVQDFALYSKLLVNGTMVALASLFFVRILKNPGNYVQRFNSLGLANSGVLLYFAGSFIIYLIMNQLVNSYVSQTLYLWVMNAMLTFIFHLMCIIALWQKDSLQPTTSPNG